MGSRKHLRKREGCYMRESQMRTARLESCSLEHQCLCAAAGWGSSSWTLQRGSKEFDHSITGHSTAVYGMKYVQKSGRLVDIYVPGTQLTSNFEGQPSKTRAFSIKTSSRYLQVMCTNTKKQNFKTVTKLSGMSPLLEKSSTFQPSKRLPYPGNNMFQPDDHAWIFIG